MDDDRILLAHGGGGALTRELIEGVIAPLLGNPATGLPDAAPVPGADGFALTTDSFVVKPLFFRGGDIGSLSVYGTVNDLAVSSRRGWNLRYSSGSSNPRQRPPKTAASESSPATRRWSPAVRQINSSSQPPESAGASSGRRR
jgi:hypothetical protein